MDAVADDVRTRMLAHLGDDPAAIGVETVTAAVHPLVEVPPAPEPAVSIVTVTYGTGPIVVDALAALAATLGDLAYEVIVVDQPPPPGADPGLPTATRLRLLTSGVRLIECAANHGFGGGNTVGVAHARAPIVVLLNPDAVVRPGWLGPLLAALDDPTIGIAAPVLVNPDGTVQEAGQTLDGEAGAHPITRRPVEASVDVVHTSAACWAIRRADYELLGGFDPHYHPAYYEDADLVLRMRRAGLRAVVVGASEVVHHLGSSTRRRTTNVFTQRAIFRTRWATELAHLDAEPGTTDLATRSSPPSR
ncbi:MAG TPA: glycosyltransferase family 2 protein [Ilumatobacter sp.]|nr:glycosyltransferase family 2 protein [Ilumatobacter sp.]